MYRSSSIFHDGLAPAFFGAALLLSPMAHATPAPTVEPANQVGTGGAFSLSFLRARGQTGYGLLPLDKASASPSFSQQATVSEGTPSSVEFVRNAFKISIRELAQLVGGVSRQAFHAWLNGRPMDDNHARRMNELAAAAEKLTQAGIETNAHTLRRPLSGGKSFLETIANVPIERDGRDEIMSTADNLIALVQKEAAQRNRLNVRLRGRQPSADAWDFA